MILLFLSAYAVAFSGAIMPGSVLTYTIRKSLSVGPRAGVIIIAGHALLELALIILIFLGFGSVLQSETAQFLISLIGGGLLIYMGGDMLIGAVKNSVKVRLDGEDKKTGGMFVSGIVISAANPYFLIWWAVVGLGFIMQAYNSFGLIGIVLYYIGHICADFTWYSFVSTVVGKTRRFIKEKPYRIIIAALGCLTVFFGGRFIYAAILYFL